jgi:hypothetical protein
MNVVILIELDIPSIFTKTTVPRKFESIIHHRADVRTKNVVADTMTIIFKRPRCEIHKFYTTPVFHPQLRKRFAVSISNIIIPLIFIRTDVVDTGRIKVNTRWLDMIRTSHI